MTIISIEELNKGRSGGLNEKTQRNYERVFRVITDNPYDNQAAVLSAVVDQIPLGSQFPGDSAYSQGYSVKATGSDHIEWDVSISYSSAYDPQQAQPPTSRPDAKGWSFTTRQVALDRDINRQAIKNSAGDPPQTAIESVEYLAVYSVTRNISEGSFSPALFWSYAGKCNADTFLGAESGQVKFIPQQATYMVDNDNGNYWQISYSFEFDPKNHAKYFMLDEGYNELNDDDESVAMKDADEKAVSDTQLLDGNGRRLPAGEPPEFLEFNIVELLDFGIFGVT